MFKHKLLNYLIILTAIFGLAAAIVPHAYAETRTCDGVETNLIGCPDDGNAIGHIISMVLTVLTVGMGVAATVGMVIVGVKYMMSRENEDQVRLAKKRFSEIVLGLAIWVVFFAVVQFIIPGGMLNPEELGLSAQPGTTTPADDDTDGDGRDDSDDDGGGTAQIVNYPARWELTSYTYEDGTTYQYWINVPEGATGNMPVMMFLHGDLPKEDAYTVRDIAQVQAMKANKNFISIAPVGHGDGTTDWVQNSTPAILKKIMEKTINEYQADRSRLYLMGFSRGTIGAWNLVDKNSDYFAAAVMVSCPPVGVTPKNFVSTPIRAYSGTAGQEAGYMRSMGEFVKQINDLGGNATYSNADYQGLDHPQMSGALKYDQIFSWMLSQKRK